MVVFKMIVFQNDRFYKIRRQPSLTIVNEEKKPT